MYGVLITVLILVIMATCLALYANFAKTTKPESKVVFTEDDIKPLCNSCEVPLSPENIVIHFEEDVLEVSWDERVGTTSYIVILYDVNGEMDRKEVTDTHAFFSEAQEASYVTVTSISENAHYIVKSQPSAKVSAESLLEDSVTFENNTIVWKTQPKKKYIVYQTFDSETKMHWTSERVHVISDASPGTSVYVAQGTKHGTIYLGETSQ